ncbi:caspase [Drosophila grimshawi]|uniref:GH19945 n=1 Tax=Drosophila grimshawi TaxID=7222 RepID=B4JRK0_DROGR|nr:caspase [Drosophila grimshawi]EDV94390.1 GH19945 [Drosophila grimshawi]
MGDTTDALGSLVTHHNALNTPSTRPDYVTKITTNRFASQYNMTHKHRGMALIFNHEHFDNNLQAARTGTNLDCAKLTHVLEQLDFDVTTYKDYRYEEILSTVKYAAAQKHDDNDCILVAILSHGGMGYIHARDEIYKLDEVWTCFTAENCPSLATKPKLFFIQACMGDRLDAGVKMQMKRIETDGDSKMSYKIPNHADFLIAYSTVPGFYSWRNKEKGSWFIQSLCEQLASNGKRLDILTLLTRVCQRVAHDFESNNSKEPEFDQKKQTPCINTMLTRILLFNDKKKTPVAAAN